MLIRRAPAHTSRFVCARRLKGPAPRDEHASVNVLCSQPWSCGQRKWLLRRPRHCPTLCLSPRASGCGETILVARAYKILNTIDPLLVQYAPQFHFASQSRLTSTMKVTIAMFLALVGSAFALPARTLFARSQEQCNAECSKACHQQYGHNLQADVCISVCSTKVCSP